MWVPSLAELQCECVGASWVTLWRKMICLLFFLLGSKQNVSEMMSWGMGLFRKKRSFYLLGLSSAGILSLSVIKLRKKTLAEKLVIPWVHKRLCGRQSGMWELSCTTGSRAAPSPWAQEITGSSRGLSQPCVFPLQLVAFLVGGVSCHCWMNSWFLLMKVVRSWKFTSQYGAEYCWELYRISSAWGCSRITSVPLEEKHPGVAGTGWILKSSSHVWIAPVCGLGVFYNVCAASRDNISFWETLDGISGRNFSSPVMDMLQWMRMLLGAVQEWWCHFGAL